MKKLVFCILTITMLFISLPQAYAESSTPYEAGIIKIQQEIQKAADKDKIAKKTVNNSKSIALASLIANYPMGSTFTNDKEIKDFLIACGLAGLDGDVILLNGTKSTINKLNIDESLYSDKKLTKNFVVVQKVKKSIFQSAKIVLELQEIKMNPNLITEKGKLAVYTKTSVPPGFIFTKKDNIKSFLVSLAGDLVLSKNIKILWLSRNSDQKYISIVGLQEVSSSLDKNNSQAIRNIKFKISYITDSKNVIQEVIFTQLP